MHRMLFACRLYVLTGIPGLIRLRLRDLIQSGKRSYKSCFTPGFKLGQ